MQNNLYPPCALLLPNNQNLNSPSLFVSPSTDFPEPSPLSLPFTNPNSHFSVYPSSLFDFPSRPRDRCTHLRDSRADHCVTKRNCTLTQLPYAFTPHTPTYQTQNIISYHALHTQNKMTSLQNSPLYYLTTSTRTPNNALSYPDRCPKLNCSWPKPIIPTPSAIEPHHISALLSSLPSAPLPAQLLLSIHRYYAELWPLSSRPIPPPHRSSHQIHTLQTIYHTIYIIYILAQAGKLQ